MSSEDRSSEERLSFPNIGEEVEDGGEGVTVVESLCMGCMQSGETRLLLTRIPHFREIILSSFYCPHCHAKNNEVKFGGQVQDTGVLLVVKCDSPADLNRQLVKGDHCTVTVPEIELEIPASGAGTLTTVEGLLAHTQEDLASLQPMRRVQEPETAARIDAFLDKLSGLSNGEVPFTLIMRDISGNSHIEYIGGPQDEKITLRAFDRTPAEDALVGASQDNVGSEEQQQQREQEEEAIPQQQVRAAQNALLTHAVAAIKKDSELAALEAAIEPPEEVMVFPEPCYICQTPGQLKMMLTSIPYFKEIVLMAFKCDTCGYKSTEVKSGGAISPMGRRIVLKVTNPEDLKRDILKSDTARLEIPEVELKLMDGTLGGMFTSLEGILRKIEEELRQTVGVFAMGDSAEPEQRARFQAFLEQMSALAEGDREFTIIIDDPMANSHLQNPYAPDPDPYMTIEDYQRTKKQDDMLGISDMKTENYQEEEEEVSAAAHERPGGEGSSGSGAPGSSS